MLPLTGTLLTGWFLAAPPVTTPEFLREAMAQEQAIGRCTSWVQIQHAVELDRSGAVKPGQELHVVRRYSGPPGQQKASIVSAERPGQDVTEDLRKSGRSSEADRFRSPFHPEMRPLYMFIQARGADPSGPMKLEFRPTYAHRRDAGLFDGVALLDRATGHVLEWRAKLVNPPTLVSRAEVQVTYGIRVGLLEARSAVHVELEGGLFFYRRQGRMDFHYTDYVCPESMPRPAGPSVSGPADAPPIQEIGERADRGG
jgi:hypothetical protein